MPHAMRAKKWPIQGGFGELFTILAGPLPGLATRLVRFGEGLLGVASQRSDARFCTVCGGSE